ncbi:MAG TPA: alpha/beta hydrolase [Puia sp.]|nr:alpha/beta hydrolase [Puia sp.]
MADLSSIADPPGRGGHFLSFRSSRFHYSCVGTGPRILFAFHGYGESAESFGFLEGALGGDFTIVAIDLPFHGATVWREGLFLGPADLLGVLTSIAAGLPGKEDGWWLMGYSMGGRVALQLLELAPGRVRCLVLLATDGLQMNFWYWLATQTTAGNALFRWTMQRPGWLFFLLRAGHVLRVVNPSIYKFTAHYVDDAQVRENLYARWTTMRGFRPDVAAVGRFVRQYAIPVRLLYGSYDRIIRWERGERFRRSNAAYCTLSLLPAGHQLLQAKFLEVIAKALYLPPDGPEARRPQPSL